MRSFLYGKNESCDEKYSVKIHMRKKIRKVKNKKTNSFFIVIIKSVMVEVKQNTIIK